MNWEAISAIGQLVGAFAVFATLIYVALQVRLSNRQAEIEAHRHTWDMLNQFCDLVAESKDVATLINKGRDSLAHLDREEALMFEHIHLRLLNTIESWHLQIERTAKDKMYRRDQLANMSGIAQGYLDFPGTRELWVKLTHYFPTISYIVDGALSEEPTVLSTPTTASTTA